MINRCYLVSNNTEISGIKYGTFHYNSSVSASNVFRYGNVCAAYIEFSYYTSNGVSVNLNDAINYYQEYDVDNSFSEISPSRSQLIGTFYAKSVEIKKDICSVVAYDSTIYLDVDFSPRLKALQSSFPMSITALVSEAATVAGVTTNLTTTSPPNVYRLQHILLKPFYANGITVRDIFAWAAEIQRCNLMATYDNPAKINIKRWQASVTPGWLSSENYIICPDDGTYYNNAVLAKNAWYKENGLEKGVEFVPYDGCEIVSSDGTVLGKYYLNTPALKVYRASGNLLLENIYGFGTGAGTFSDMDEVAQYMMPYYDSGSNPTATFIPITAKLFPFRCPFTIAGNVVYSVDTDGNHYVFPAMYVDFTDSEVTISAFGENVEEQHRGGFQTADQSALSLDVRVTDLESKVDSLSQLFTTVSFSGTTDSNGILSTTYTYDEYIPVFARIGGAICEVFTTTLSAGNLISIRVLYTTGNTVANVNVSATITLMKR